MFLYARQLAGGYVANPEALTSRTVRTWLARPAPADRHSRPGRRKNVTLEDEALLLYIKAQQPEITASAARASFLWMRWSEEVQRPSAAVKTARYGFRVARGRPGR